jgi:hypothetical protein
VCRTRRAADLDAVFETQWRKSSFDAAMERVKARFTLKQFHTHHTRAWA